MVRNKEWKRSGHITGDRPDTRGLPVEDAADRELESYFNMLIEELVGEGWEIDAARQEAIRRFGDPEKVRGESEEIMRSNDRKQRLSLLLDEIWKDTRYAFRTIRTTPGFTVIAVLILAIGIGANVAIFSMLKGLILQPMPFPEPHRIVAVWETELGRRTYQPLTGPDYWDMREQNSSFEEFGVYTFRWFNVFVQDQSERVRGVITTASVMRALGIPPLHGRLFGDEEESEERNRVVIIGHQYWMDRYNGNPDLVGEWITLNRESYLVLAIMPEYFDFPSPWGRAEPVKMWIPLEPPREESARGAHWLASLGRLKDGVKVQQAEADLKVIAASLREEYPDSNAQVDVWIDPLMRRALGGIASTLAILLIVVGFVLLIACANVASMLLARGAARQNEVAIRLSLGALKRRLIRQLLTESFILSLIGGIAGTLLAFWSLGTLKGLLPATVPRIEGIQIDGWVLLFAFLAAMVTGLVFGLAPALISSRTNLSTALTGGGGSRTGGRRRNRLLSVLVVGQLALALMLVNAAILLFISYRNVALVPQGFDKEEVLVASIELTGPAYEEDGSRLAFWERLISRLESSPGVTRAAVTSKLPISGGTNGSVLVEGETYDPEARHPLIELSFVTPGYFEAMGIEVERGRGIEQADITATDTESEEHVVVVNQAFVDRYWSEGGEDEEEGVEPIGQRIRQNSAQPEWTSTVVGVAENVRQWGILYPPLAERYHPFSLTSRAGAYLVVRAERNPAALVPVVREAVREIDPLLPVDGFRTMADMVHGAMQGMRLITLLIGLFTLIAVILAASGTYGVMSFGITQRVHEIGVRVALGADRSRVLWHFIYRGLRLTLLGGAIGIALAVVATIVLSSSIYGMQPVQALYLLGGIVFLGLIMVLASAVPAMRATRVDPVEALRTE